MVSRLRQRTFPSIVIIRFYLYPSWYFLFWLNKKAQNDLFLLKKREYEISGDKT